MSRDAEWVPSLWMDIFNELIDDDNELDYGDEWRLNFNYSQANCVSDEERKRGWKVSCSTAFGNFRCSSCCRTWPSARVTVFFRYRLRSGRGTVLMRPFGQACRTCDKDFILPGFSEDEVTKNLLRLFSKIRKNCYRDVDEPVNDDRDSQNNMRRTKPHEAELCEACSQGICTLKEEDD